jgi:hypothetical protein
MNFQSIKYEDTMRNIISLNKKLQKDYIFTIRFHIISTDIKKTKGAIILKPFSRTIISYILLVILPTIAVCSLLCTYHIINIKK